MEDILFPRVNLSKEEKIKYINSVISRTHKALHLIEEENETGYSPIPFMTGLMFELNAADFLYDNEFATIIVKFEGIRKNYVTMDFKDVKKQIFEITRILKHIMRGIMED